MTALTSRIDYYIYFVNKCNKSRGRQYAIGRKYQNPVGLCQVDLTLK